MKTLNFPYVLVSFIGLLLLTFTTKLMNGYSSGSVPLSENRTSVSSGQVELVNLYSKGKSAYPWSCPDSLGIQVKKNISGYLPFNINIKIINQDSPFLTKTDTTIIVNRTDIFDTLYYFQLPCFDEKKTNLTDIIVVEALPGDTASPIGNDTTKLKKEYCIKYTLDEMNYVDQCKSNDTTFGISNGIFLASFKNNCPTPFPVKSVEHVFRNNISEPGKQYQIVVYRDTTSGSPGSLLYASTALTSPVGNGSDQRIEHILSSTVNIPANRKFFIGYKQLSSGSIGAAGQEENPVRLGSFYSSTNSGSTWTDFKNSSYNIRLDIEPQTNPRLYVKLVNEGFYSPYSNNSVSDTFRLYARNTSSPYSVVDSSVSIVGGTDLDGVFDFNTLNRGTAYYLQVRHRNHIQTWSSTPILFRRYDFTTSASQAFGSNSIIVDSNPIVYGFYAGDVNQDGSVDATDASDIDNDASNFVAGYVVSDLNGDNFTDGSDYQLADNNAFNFVSAVFP